MSSSSVPDVTPELVGTEAELREAWADPLETSIRLAADIAMRSCKTGGPIRESIRPLVLDGDGFSIRQTCFEKRILRQDGTGFLLIENISLSRGGNDGPGAAITTRGEIVITDSAIQENLAEEPGGAIFSQRRITVARSIFTGNFAWDDGGALYARRGGVDVYDSVLSNNLVDGSGGAIGTTGDILVVRSHVDGNTTDGDGGALYADEDGDITVIDSTVDGNTADGPGGAIFTLDGDVTIVGSTLNGNRADDRGGAISGEADVIVIDSTIARNAAVAHVGGGIWARSDAIIINSTISNNYAEGQGGGVQAAGDVTLAYSTVTDNVGPVASNVGATRVHAFGSIIGPPDPDPPGGESPAYRSELPHRPPHDLIGLQCGHRRLVRARRCGRHGRRGCPLPAIRWPSTVASARRGRRWAGASSSIGSRAPSVRSCPSSTSSKGSSTSPSSASTSRSRSRWTNAVSPVPRATDATSGQWRSSHDDRA